MKTNLFALFLIFSLLSKVAIAADPIVLLNLENDDEYGPFELVNGEVIELEGSEYEVLIEEESEARKALISRLKTTIIETVNFREASFDKVMEFARTIGTEPLNIISILGEFEEDEVITLQLHNIPAYDFLHYIAEIGGFEIRIDDYAVVFFWPDEWEEWEEDEEEDWEEEDDEE
jgi:alpha-acetolactate decarboxylase